jgi:crotonobetainyl-CoA:carnitine CoA-transferase CaiB-like acyl-CoA transferase
VASEQAIARDMVMQVPHPVEGEFRALGFPVKMRGTPQEVRLPPPLLNEHDAEIRRELAERGLLPAASEAVA